MQPSYAELHCLSNFSFLRAASHPEELVERALALGYTGLAITDECSFAGAVRAHLALRALTLPSPASRERAHLPPISRRSSLMHAGCISYCPAEAGSPAN
jgi:hypothetical protein